MWTGMRWSIAVLTSIAVVALIYHNAVPRTQRWHIVLPGAALATGMWFRGHFAVRCYLNRYADYGVIYGSRWYRFASLDVFALVRRAGWCRVQCGALSTCRCVSTKAPGNATIACRAA